MSSATLTRLVLVCVVGIALQLLCVAGATQCPKVGCLSGAAIGVPIPPSILERIDGATLTVCRNGECIQTPFDGDGCGFTTTGTTKLRLFTCHLDHDDAGTFRLRAFALDLSPQFFYGAGALADGDRYIVSITEGAETTVLADQEVTYSRHRPNGLFCGPTCQSAFVGTRE